MKATSHGSNILKHEVGDVDGGYTMVPLHVSNGGQKWQRMVEEVATKPRENEGKRLDQGVCKWSEVAGRRGWAELVVNSDGGEDGLPRGEGKEKTEKRERKTKRESV